MKNKSADTHNGNIYDVLEMPHMKKDIRMGIDGLKLFCNDRSLPLFCLEVRETIHGNISVPVKETYKKFFTIYQDWCFFAVVKRDNTAAVERQDVVV